jgi:hypothetical protein
MKKYLMIIMVLSLLVMAACEGETAAEKFERLDQQAQQTTVEVTEMPSGGHQQLETPSESKGQGPVCGDGKCEGNEPEEKCDDCPSCNDFNKCTRDYFSIADGRCKHDRRVPCCGDGECEASEVDFCVEDCGSDILLDDFPEPFIEDNNWNMFLIIGKRGTSGEVIAATSITDGLAYLDVTQGYSKYAKLDNEIETISGKNVILIGNPCTNTFIEQLMPFSNDCLEEFSAGEGLIKLFKTGADSYALIVAGHSDDDVRRAASILGNYKAAGLKGHQRKV